jgi:hypothetical protein
MFSIGQQVRVTGVFAESFSGVYTILDVVNSPDGSVAYILDQDAGGFDATYLAAA